MPSVKVVDMTGKEVGEISLSEKLFGAEVSEPVLHAAVRAYLLIRDRAHSPLLPAPRSRAAARSPGDRKAPDAPVRVRPVRLSGRTAAWLSVPSPEITA